MNNLGDRKIRRKVKLSMEFEYEYTPEYYPDEIADDPRKCLKFDLENDAQAAFDCMTLDDDSIKEIK